MILINYGFLHLAESFYSKSGFQRIEAPWWVPESILNITKPEGAGDPYSLSKNKKCLVASAEQSFLYLSNQGLLLPGLYQATTPCFRDEIQGPMRRKFFMKNELMVAEPSQLKEGYTVDKITEVALEFFKERVPNPSALHVLATEEGFDIEYSGIELGSYGKRETSFLTWIYGTGCAEPRLSWAIAQTRKNNE